MLHEKTTVAMFWVFGKSVNSLGREEGLIKSPLKPMRRTLLASLGFMGFSLYGTGLTTGSMQLKSSSNQDAGCPYRNSLSCPAKQPGTCAQAGGCTQQLFCFSYPPADEEQAWMSLRGTEQRVYGYRCGKLMCLQRVVWKLVQLHRDVGVSSWGASSPFEAAHLLLASCSPYLVFTQVKL